MIESFWHGKVRRRIYEMSKPNAFTSHDQIGNLNLFKGQTRIKNCLSEADIVVLDPNSKKVVKIIEIETALNPKKIMGIVMATHVCDSCRIKGVDYHLRDIELEIIFREAPSGSKKDLKLAVIKPILDQFIKESKGCISKLKIRPHARD